MNDKVEFIENLCEIHLTEVEILVKVPYNGELTDCYASAIYCGKSIRSMKVVTYEHYNTIYEYGESGVYTKEIDIVHIEQVVELLNKQL